METIIGAKREFYRWILSLKKECLSDYDKTFINLLLNHFTEIEALSGEERATFLGKLIEDQKNQVFSDTKEWVCGGSTNDGVTNRIDHVKINDSDEFGIGEDLGLHGQYNFFYDMEESRRERLRSTLEQGLLKETGEFLLKGRDKFGKEISVEANLEAYRHCFIDKTRLDEFSKSAVLESKSNIDRLAELFGFKEFKDFVNGFIDVFDGKYLCLTNENGMNIKEELADLEDNKRRLEFVDKSIGEQQQRAEEMIASLKNSSVTNMQELRVFLSGEDGNSGIIGELNKRELQVGTEDFQVDTYGNLKRSLDVIKVLVQQLDQELEAFLSTAMELNYNELFLSIKRISFYYEEDQIVTNPFEGENEELEKIQILLTLQGSIQKNALEMGTEVQRFNETIEQMNHIFHAMGANETDFIKITPVENTSVKDMKQWCGRVKTEINPFEQVIEKEDHYIELIESYNRELSRRRESISQVEAELERYLHLQLDYEGIELRLQSLEEEKRSLLEKVSGKDEFYAERLKEVELETEKVEYNNYMKFCYDKWIPSMKEYRDRITVEHTTGLSERAKEYYNIINEGTTYFDRLDELKLPKVSTDKIVTRFNGETKEYEAFQVLSEENMKILGFCLLLSKLVREDRGFYIVDEVLDSLSEEHKEGLVDFLIKNQEVNRKQIIIISEKGIFAQKMELKLGR